MLTRIHVVTIIICKSFLPSSIASASIQEDDDEKEEEKESKMNDRSAPKVTKNCSCVEEKPALSSFGYTDRNETTTTRLRLIMNNE